MKHAYLIIAHNELEVLKRLISALDDERNDIYIHIDQKATFDGSELRVDNSKLYVLLDRLDARWGDFSLVEVELLLMEKAISMGNYSYLHLLSGVDYPIKSQDYIHKYCEEHWGTEFIGFAQNVDPKDLFWRAQHYFLFSREFQNANFFKKTLRALFARLQSICCYRRTKMEVKKGAQWCSFTSDFGIFVISNKNELRKNFSHTYCPDELIMQTLCWNSDFRGKIYSVTDEFVGCKRYIPWKNGALLPLTKADLLRMKESECWFARKFTNENLDIWEFL